MPEDFSQYVPVSTVQAHDAERIIGILADSGLRLAFEPDNSEVQSLSVMQARFGGTFGSGPKVIIHVHHQDLPIYESIQSKHFNEFHELPTEEEEAPTSEQRSLSALWLTGIIFAVAIAFYVSQHWGLYDKPAVSNSPNTEIHTLRKLNPEIIAEFKESEEFIDRALKEDESQEAPEDTSLDFPPQL